MSTTTLTAEGRSLVIKAALRLVQDRRDARYKGLVWKTRLNAFAEVAADVLNIARTPAGFEMALSEALEAAPLPWVMTMAAERARQERTEWADRLVDAYLAAVLN